jgi:hypothetical protein
VAEKLAGASYVANLRQIAHVSPLQPFRRNRTLEDLDDRFCIVTVTKGRQQNQEIGWIAANF